MAAATPHIVTLQRSINAEFLVKREPYKYNGGIRTIALACLLFFSNIASAQQKITGVVLNENNLQLSGATVTIKGSNTSIITSTDGSFSITAKAGDVLEVSFVGFKTSEIKIGTETNLRINLQPTILALDVVVLTGYTFQKVKEITGSVALVKPKDLTAIPAGQVEQMLQGRVAGLNVITSGMPGGASNVRLHGIGNFGDVTPLYIIDGVQGNINNLNPNDVEALQVLKDAGAYAIYGVRGANGVIIISTRNGKAGKTKISYDSYISTTRPLKNPLDLTSPQEMGELTWLALKNSNQPQSHPFFGNGTTPVLPDYFIAGENIGLSANNPRVNPDLYNIDFGNGDIHQIVQTNKTGTDWFDKVFKPAFSQNHSITVSGANEKNRYLLSLGYLNQQGTLLKTYLKRYTVRTNTEFAVSDKIRVGENLQLAYRDNPRIATQQGPNFNEVIQGMLTSPVYPVYDIKGGWAHLFPGYFDDNPVAVRTIAKDDKTHWEIFGNLFAEADLFKYFTVRTSFGGNLVNYYVYNYRYNTYENRLGAFDNSFSESSGYQRSWTWTNTIKFLKNFTNEHRVTALTGVEAINNYNREVGGRKVGLLINDVNYRLLSNGSQVGQSNYSIASASSLFSFINKVDYGFREKYFLSATLRSDGSSVFSSQHRFGWFPSISAAWRITEEKFLQDSKWLSDIKIRASWGKTGFYGNTDPYNQYTLYGGTVGDAAYDIFGNSTNPVQGFRALRIGEPKTDWQEDVVTNLGFESVLWNGRLSITADWYHKKAKGLLFRAGLPDVVGGATRPNTNVGIIQNNGLDILLGSKGKIGSNWQWDATITFTTYKNKIVKLNDLPFFIPDISIAGPFVRNAVGQAAGAFYGHKVIGIFKNDDEVNKAPAQDGKKPGRFRYLDANNDKIINDEDRVYFGDPNPDLQRV